MSEIRAVVAEAKQAEIGRGIARINRKSMNKLGIEAGDPIEIVGKRRTVATAWPARAEDEATNLIRIDGFIRKNAEVGIKEKVMIRKTEVQEATRLVLAPVDIRLNVDEDFTNFVKNKLMERSFVEGDNVLVTMLGHKIPFEVFRARPRKVPIRVTEDTVFLILNEPLPLERQVRPPLDIKYLLRIAWLKNLVNLTKAKKVVFFIEGSEFADENEQKVVEEAKELAGDDFSTVHINVSFESNRGVLGELPWVDVDPLGGISSTYPDVPLPPSIPAIVQEGAHEKAIPPMRRCFKTGVMHCPKDIKLSLRSVVVAMPFGDDFKDTYTYAIRPALEESGFKPWKADEQISNIDIMCKICQALQESGYILANITTWNPNVVFELGLAYGLGRSAILIKHKKAEVPVDLKGIEYIEYGTIDELKRNLSLFLKQATEQK